MDEQTVSVPVDVARAALSLAYSRMGQRDGQGERARQVAESLHALLTKAESSVAALPALHQSEDPEPMRPEYVYDAVGRGTHEMVVARVLEAWARLDPAGDATRALQGAGSAYLLETSNLARIAAHAAVSAAHELEG